MIIALVEVKSLHWNNCKLHWYECNHYSTYRVTEYSKGLCLRCNFLALYLAHSRHLSMYDMNTFPP